MITSEDLEKIKQANSQFVTKDDLNKTLNNALKTSENEITKYMQVTIQVAIEGAKVDLRQEMHEMKKELRSEMFSMKMEISKEIQDLRTIMKQEISQLRDIFYVFLDEIKALRVDMNNHEKRMTKLEKISTN